MQYDKTRRFYFNVTIILSVSLKHILKKRIFLCKLMIEIKRKKEEFSNILEAVLISGTYAGIARIITPRYIMTAGYTNMA
jgi:hypothetical protein